MIAVEVTKGYEISCILDGSRSTENEAIGGTRKSQVYGRNRVNHQKLIIRQRRRVQWSNRAIYNKRRRFDWTQSVTLMMSFGSYKSSSECHWCTSLLVMEPSLEQEQRSISEKGVPKWNVASRSFLSYFHTISVKAWTICETRRSTGWLNLIRVRLFTQSSL